MALPAPSRSASPSAAPVLPAPSQPAPAPTTSPNPAAAPAASPWEAQAAAPAVAASPAPGAVASGTAAALAAAGAAGTATASAAGTPAQDNSAGTGSSDSAGSASATSAALVPPSSSAAHLHNPAPPYPALSRRLGEQGRVVLRVRIEADGRASAVELYASSGHARLDQAALQAVARWRFVPGTRNGVPEAMWFHVPLHFVLE